MFSDDRVAELAQRFVRVKADPRAPTFDSDTRRYKKTRYVPEVAIVGADGEILIDVGRQARQPASLAAAMEKALERQSERTR